jgi:type I site-specific restriction endonuclease
MHRFGSETRYESDVIDRFRDTDRPQILIVVNKLLTGFDVPRNSVLYLTRPLSSHLLFQAISRTNRSYEGKVQGLLVDYVGIISELDDALSSIAGLYVNRSTKGQHRTLTAPEVPRSDHEFANLIPPAVSSMAAGTAQTLKHTLEKILQEQLANAVISLRPTVTKLLAADIAAVILARRKVDWTSDVDVQNRMATAIEDELFRAQDDQGIAFDFPTIDSILERCLEAARALVP